MGEQSHEGYEVLLKAQAARRVSPGCALHVAIGRTTGLRSDGNSDGSGRSTSNEDPTQEAGESAQREADENSGKAFHGGGRHGFNEDPAHEASESPEREAQEDAGRGAPSAGSSSSSDGTATLQ